VYLLLAFETSSLHVRLFVLANGGLANGIKVKHGDIGTYGVKDV
jgi:hypothetical protein